MKGFCVGDMSPTWGSGREQEPKSGIEKTRAAGQRRTPNIRYVGDTTSDNVSTTQADGCVKLHGRHPKAELI